MSIHAPIADLHLTAFGRFMPMFMAVDDAGMIRAIGPTLRRVLGSPAPLGRALFDVVEFRRPSGVTSIADLRRKAGVQLNLRLRDDPEVNLRGLAMPIGDGTVLMNLSFGIGVIDAVRRYGLTAAQFAATDLTIELLYLVEAKAAVMGELKRLNARLDGAKKQAEEQALTDVLTGLRNRRALDMMLETMLESRTPFGLMHLDLDYFKAVNDTRGHAAGDHVLRQVAGILRRETRAGDTIARVGGDEFVLVLPHMTDLDQLRSIATRLIGSLSQPIDFEGEDCKISGSIGMVASTHYLEVDVERMAADADAALYAAKRAGRGRARLFHA